LAWIWIWISFCISHFIWILRISTYYCSIRLTNHIIFISWIITIIIIHIIMISISLIVHFIGSWILIWHIHLVWTHLRRHMMRRIMIIIILIAIGITTIIHRHTINIFIFWHNHISIIIRVRILWWMLWELMLRLLNLLLLLFIILIIHLIIGIHVMSMRIIAIRRRGSIIWSHHRTIHVHIVTISLFIHLLI